MSKPDCYAKQDIADALNRAADDILEATDADDEGLCDALNLMVNASMNYLTDTADTLERVAETNYEASLPEILDWIAR